MNTRNVVLGIVVIAVLVIGWLTLGGGLGGAKPTPTPIAALSDLDNIVSASGTLLPAKRANLSFKVPGQVIQVPVKAGDSVKRGDVLVRLDTTELDAAAAQAKAGVSVAQANLDAARAQLAKVRAGAKPEDIAIAKATLERAEASLRDAQAAFDRVRGELNIGMLPQSQALHLATQDYRIAKARYDQVVKGASPEDIRVAEAAVVTAQAQLEQAQAAHQQAQVNLGAYTLTAPFGGTAASVSVREGETVTPGMPIITLGDVATLRLETDDLSETNIARIKVGQTVSVTFEALVGRTFRGTIVSIAPIATAKAGGTNYTVTIELEKMDPALLWGMTGHVEINTKQ